MLCYIIFLVASNTHSTVLRLAMHTYKKQVHGLTTKWPFISFKWFDGIHLFILEFFSFAGHNIICGNYSCIFHHHFDGFRARNLVMFMLYCFTTV